jgi:four helix bundle protein
MEYVKSFRELLVYKLSRKVSKEVFMLTRDFPKEERYSLTDQVRRSTRAVGAQIAEAWGKRRYEQHFISKLTDADSEQLETQHWIDVAEESEYITNFQKEQLISDCEQIGKMLQSMINKSGMFCNPDKISN